jgi:hypothetical protein
MDIYGELIDAVYLYDKYGTPISYDFWTIFENWSIGSVTTGGGPMRVFGRSAGDDSTSCTPR